MTFRRIIVSLRGPGQSPVLPFACCVGSLRSVGRCGRCSCWCRFRGRGAQSLESGFSRCAGGCKAVGGQWGAGQKWCRAEVTGIPSKGEEGGVTPSSGASLPPRAPFSGGNWVGLGGEWVGPPPPCDIPSGCCFFTGALDSHPFVPSHVASGRCVLTAAAAGAPAALVPPFPGLERPPPRPPHKPISLTSMRRGGGGGYSRGIPGYGACLLRRSQACIRREEGWGGPEPECLCTRNGPDQCFFLQYVLSKIQNK